MKWLKMIFGGGSPIKEIGETIDKLTTSGAEKSAARQKALETMVSAQAAVIVAEANAGGLAALWRPITMLSFVGIIWWYVLSATFGWTTPDLSQIPERLWSLMTIGIGGYGSLRSVEKVVNAVAPQKQKG